MYGVKTDHDLLKTPAAVISIHITQEIYTNVCPVSNNYEISMVYPTGSCQVIELRIQQKQLFMSVLYTHARVCTRTCTHAHTQLLFISCCQLHASAGKWCIARTRVNFRVHRRNEVSAISRHVTR